MAKSKYVLDDLSNKENEFKKNLTDSAGKLFKATKAVAPLAIGLSHLNDNWYFKEKTPKNKIVLHFTCGNIMSDVATLTTHFVSVSYVVDRQGNIYELFSPDYWSYHLGYGATGENTTQSKASIAIELSSYGPLKPKENDPEALYNIYDRAYCRLSDQQEYGYGLYRGYSYWVKPTAAQYSAVRSLLLFLTKRYPNIPYTLPSNVEQEQQHFKTIMPPGIWSHQNFRKDKVDVGPIFDWSKLKP